MIRDAQCCRSCKSPKRYNHYCSTIWNHICVVSSCLPVASDMNVQPDELCMPLERSKQIRYLHVLLRGFPPGKRLSLPRPLSPNTLSWRAAERRGCSEQAVIHRRKDRVFYTGEACRRECWTGHGPTPPRHLTAVDSFRTRPTSCCKKNI